MTTSYTHPDAMRGHVAIVTGAAQGVGKGIATALLERGASVLLVDIQDELLSATTAELTAAGRVENLVADLRDPDSAQRIVAAAVDAFGTVHGLVNNAIATNEPKRFVDITTADLALGYDVGPRATFLLMQAVHPVMVEAGGGSIVNLGSGTGTGGEAKRGCSAPTRRSSPVRQFTSTAESVASVDVRRVQWASRLTSLSKTKGNACAAGTTPVRSGACALA